jgi:AcrR family transcriptional regulator
MLHHYPSKEALVAATVDYVFNKRLEEFREAFQELPDDADRRGLAIDLLWKIFSGDTFYVWLELLVASRTDPKLHAVTSDIGERFSASIQAANEEIFPSSERTAPFDEMAQKFAFAMLTGMAVDRIIPDELPAEAMLNVLKLISRTMRETNAAVE